MHVFRSLLLVASALLLSLNLSAQPVQEKQMSIVVKKTATWCSNCGSWGWQWFKDVIDDSHQIISTYSEGFNVVFLFNSEAGVQQ